MATTRRPNATTRPDKGLVKVALTRAELDLVHSAVYVLTAPDDVDEDPLLQKLEAAIERGKRTSTDEYKYPDP